MKNTILVFTVILLNFCNLFSQSTAVFDPDDILIGDREIPKVLLVGTFHFDYPNLDAHKTDPDKQIDVKSEERQKEVEELLNYIALFQPTKIVVERWKNSDTNERYHAYLRGDYELRKSETDQLGFRLAKQFGIKDLILADAPTMVRSFYHGPDSTCLRPIMDSIYQDWDFKSDDPTKKLYGKLYDYEDEAELSMTLLESFRAANDEKRLRRGHGAYLVGDFKNGDNYEGADALAMHWYARNLRIFRNIQKSNASSDDRILVLYGSGHMSILKHLFESTPEYELIQFNELENLTIIE